MRNTSIKFTCGQRVALSHLDIECPQQTHLALEVQYGDKRRHDRLALWLNSLVALSVLTGAVVKVKQCDRILLVQVIKQQEAQALAS